MSDPTRRSYAKLTLGGVTLPHVTSVEGTEGLGELFQYDVVALAEPGLPGGKALLEGGATLVLTDPWGGTRTVHGVLSEACALHRDDGTVEVHATLRPAAHALTLGRNSRPFQDVTVVDIARAVTAGLPAVRLELGGDYPRYPWVVQYREDDWTFLRRWLETEGIYAWFDPADGALVLSDESRAAPPIEGRSVLPYRGAGGQAASEAAVIFASRSARVASGRFTAASFDMKNPSLKVAASSGAGGHEVYDAPGGGPSDPAVLARRTACALEEATAASAGLGGLSTSVQLVPGRTFTLVDHPASELDAEYFVTRVAIAVRDGATASTRFSAIPKGTRFRPPRVTPEAKQAGLQMGTVVGAVGSEVHPSELGEVRVKLRWDRTSASDDTSGTWMRVAQRCAPGSMMLPRVGWNVATFNEEGAVDAPSVLARIHDGEHPPTYPLPANMTRTTYKTATTPGGGSHNEIHFEDKRGSEVMFIHASRDMSTRVQNLGNEIVRNDSKRTVGSIRKVDVGATYTERVILDRSIAVAGNEVIEVAEQRTKTVAQNDTNVIGGSRKLDVGDTHHLNASKGRTLTVGSMMLDVTLGDVTSGSKDHQTLVGGLVTKVSAANVEQQDGEVGISVVGGARIDVAKQNHARTGEKSLREMVGAVVKIKAGERYLDTAETTSAWKVGAQLSGDAPQVSFRATKSIKITCGANTLQIDETSIQIDAKKLVLSGSQLDTDSDDIDHN